MQNKDVKTVELLSSTSRLLKALDNEVDWYIASFTEKDQKKRKLAKLLFQEKQQERVQAAKEVYELSK